MKLTQVRYFSHASIILICCCIPIAFAASAAAAPFSFPDWVELSPNDPPPARSALAMTYDPISGKIIAFGGFGGTGYLNDTWSFDGTSWLWDQVGATWIQLSTAHSLSAGTATTKIYTLSLHRALPISHAQPELV